MEEGNRINMHHTILVHIARVNLEEHGTKIETVRYSPVNLGGQKVQKECTVRFQVYFNLQWHAGRR